MVIIVYTKEKTKFSTAKELDEYLAKIERLASEGNIESVILKILNCKGRCTVNYICSEYGFLKGEVLAVIKNLETRGEVRVLED